MWHKIPRVFKSFYFLFAVVFIVWMLFIDSNDLYSQFSRTRKLKELEKQKRFYKEKIQEVEKDREELLSDEALLEKFAREKYLMKKESEDLYVIVEKED
ncbi:septum formation initiator family protein [Bacteroidota bacterium]